ncbi:MAG: chemotaxis protein CheW [Bdellovibrionota bacterium]
MNMPTEMKKTALSEYLDECQEMLEHLSKNLASIEKNGSDKDTLAAIYREMHTIKGTSQLFGFSKIGNLAHMMETCLDPVRKGKINMSHELLDNIYAGMDFMELLIQGVRDKNQESDIPIPIEKLLPKFISITERSLTGLRPLMSDKILSQQKISFDSSSSKKGTTPVSSENNTKNSGFELFEDPPAQTPTPITPAKATVDTKPKLETIQKISIEDPQSETIRVQVSILDSLMNLVGELVLIRNQLLQHTKSNDENTEFLKLSQRLNILTAELQNEVMKTRMQPIGNIFNMFSRVVRDVSKELGKKIDLDLQGTDTELDKTILEAVKDPLMHIVRNALDHGVEPVDERKKLGKKEIAILKLTAYHESGQVIIEIIDDGRGLSREKIGGKAVEKGLIAADTFSKMTDKEVQLLIFSPGFSTASAISNISGRGVGMDVVKTNIERIGGVVDILSKPGYGTTIKLKIPLSLAIVPALIVRAGGQRFAIPQTKLVELIRIEKSSSTSEKIESLQGKPVLRLRGKLLPIVSLSEILHHETEEKKLSLDEEIYNIVVLNADGHFFGLVVDAIDDSVDIVVKSLSSFLKDIKVFSGATIMGDGAVALTIDVMGISEIAGLAADNTDTRASAREEIPTSISSYRSENCDILLINIGAAESYAIPLAVVSRIEEFDASQFEHSGEQKVIRYRNSLLPIFSLPNFLNLPFKSEKQNQDGKTPIVVIKRGDHLYGIEVCEIQDIIEVSSQIDQSVRDRPGILGTVILKDRMIVIVDILGMIDTLQVKLDIVGRTPKETGKPAITSKNIASRRQRRILVVEDSSFFRNYMRQLLQGAGYLVEVACDGQEGFAQLSNSPANHFSLILSDIEMPVMDGLELARKVRASETHKHLPMCAITTRFSTNDIEQGKLAGFTNYLEKLNAEKLVMDIDEIFCNAQTQEKSA